MNDSIIESIERYYSGKLKEFGRTPRGVDWNDSVSQIIRFNVLSNVIEKKDNVSVNDLGCGIGSYLDYLYENSYNDFHYRGYDFSSEMINDCLSRFNNNLQSTFSKINNTNEIAPADYTIASGIFNIKMNYQNEYWLKYILETLHSINEKSLRGFAFNILTVYSDANKMREDLFYADPCFFFDYCKRHFAKNVALLHDYELYEFSILIRKK